MKFVLCNGVFDVLHIGHVLHLRAARKMGDYLIVAITKDKSVNKGPGRPVFTENQRESMLRELRCVSGTVLVDDPVEALDLLRPDIWVLGSEYRNRIQRPHWEFCLQHNIDVAFTNEPVYSSTKLLEANALAR